MRSLFARDVVLATARLVARPLRRLHEPALNALFGDARVSWDFAASNLPSPVGSDALRVAEARYAEGHGHCALHRRDDDAFLGLAGLIWQDIDEARELEVGYRLTHAEWGKGYATEAAIAFRDLAFDHTSVPRVIAIIRPDNHRSVAVAERAGLSFVKTTRWHRVPDPVALHAITRDDWLARTPTTG